MWNNVMRHIKAIKKYEKFQYISFISELNFYIKYIFINEIQVRYFAISSCYLTVFNGVWIFSSSLFTGTSRYKYSVFGRNKGSDSAFFNASFSLHLLKKNSEIPGFLTCSRCSGIEKAMRKPQGRKKHSTQSPIASHWGFVIGLAEMLEVIDNSLEGDEIVEQYLRANICLCFFHWVFLFYPLSRDDYENNCITDLFLSSR